jgi:UDP-4-amino-4,6-dideoxy-N-acetyl-beta-L-altrosamine N-acetyltransferase
MIDFGHEIKLGTINPEHLETLRRWRNEPEIWAWCRQSDLISFIDQEMWYRQLAEDPRSKMYLVLNEQRTPVGVCGFTDIHPLHRRAEFSLYIAKEYQKRTYGKKTLLTLFKHGFQNLGLNVIWGETFLGNHAAKVFENLGMESEGTRKQFYFKDGEFIDAFLYSITAEKWKLLHS